jgi:hypothetical protein
MSIPRPGDKFGSEEMLMLLRTVEIEDRQGPGDKDVDVGELVQPPELKKSCSI